MTAFCQRAVFALMTLALSVLLSHGTAYAAITIPLTVNLSENVTVTGTPRIAVDVGGTTRYADYTGGSGSSTLTFTLSPQAGDVDLDGITVTSPIQLNSGTIKDAAGNDATLTFTPPNTSGIKIDYPSLSLDFIADADGRYTLNGTVYNDLTSFLSAAGGAFARTSTATYFDTSGVMQTASSDSPRFDYDPVTHAQKGLLIEEGRTNFILRSQEINNSWWSSLYCTITPDTTISPDGTMTADAFWGTTGGTNMLYKNAISVTPSSNYTFSAYFKKINTNDVRLRVFDGATGAISLGSMTFNFNSIMITASSGFSTSNFQSIGNGWYRIWGVFNSSSNTSVILYLFPNNTNDTSGAYVWGTQLEAGSFPTSYIPTTTAAMTRAADALNVPIGGWFNPASGSISSITTSSGMSSSSYPGIVDFYLSGTERFGTYYNSSGSGLVAQQRSGGTNPTIGINGSYSGILVKNAASFGNSGTHLSTNGSSVLASSGGGFPTGIITLRIGRFDNYLNGYLSSLKYYPSQVADTQLQRLSQ